LNARNDSHDLTRVGPGTVMGEFMRQYWIPALRGDELAAGGDPVRLMLLGALNWSPHWYRAGGAQSPRAIARQFTALLRQGQETPA
jgi:hypothetical protein